MNAQLRALRDLVWPAACVACAAAGQRLCVACALDIMRVRDPRWHSPDPCPTSFPPTVTWGDYDGALRRVVVAHKDEDRLDAARLLAGPLAEVLGIALHGLRDPVLVPIPSAARSRRRRGRDPLVDILAQVRLDDAPPVLPLLRQRRQVVDQARLDHDARRTNLHFALEVRSRWGAALRRRDVVLIDDVVTTGATLAEATRAVLEDPRGGGEVNSLCAVVLCATQRLDTAAQDVAAGEKQETADLPRGRLLD